MALPVSVVCDRGMGGGGPLDLTPRIAEGSLDWSSVVPGGFASCSFQIDGDFRRTLKDIPYLSTIRIVGDSGTILWEGQVEDLSPTLSEDSVGLKVTAMGWQNVLKETSVRAIWAKRDMDWVLAPGGHGALWPTVSGGVNLANDVMDVAIGQYDPTNLASSGIQVAGNGTAIPNNYGGLAYWRSLGLTLQRVMGTLTVVTALTSFRGVVVYYTSSTGAGTSSIQGAGGGAFSIAIGGTNDAVAIGSVNTSASPITPTSANMLQFSDLRILGTAVTEDVTDGFYGDTLIKNLLSSYVTELGQGVIESGSDFAIDHLDATVRRTAYEILQEIAAYYSREWAVWEGALLDWRTPNLTQPQWVIPITALSGLDLDASVTNSQKTAVVLYTDAASQLSAEQSSVSADRRNPYVLNGRVKDELVSMGTMTSNTAQQLATILLNDLGFGPVPAAGTITLPGDTLIQHASGNAVKAWEIRAGQNVTIPELPMADIFTQDGRGEVLFHIISAEASTAKGEVTLTLDSYGSKRSDVLMARIAAVTKLLGG